MFEQLRKKKFVRFFGINLTGSLAILVFTTLNSILTARLLGAEDKGLYTLVYSTINISVTVLSLKFALAQAFFRKEHSFDELASNSIVLTFLSAALSVTVVALIIPFFTDSLYKDVPSNLLVLALVGVPIFLLAVNMKTMLSADYDIPRSTLVQTSRSFLFFVAFSTLAIFGMVNLENAVMCILFSLAGMACLSLLMLKKHGFAKFKPNKALYKPMVAFSLKTHVGLIFKFLQYRFDVFLVAYFLSPREVGIYSVALASAEVLWKIPRVANNVLLPRLRGESDRRSAELTARLNRIILVFTLSCLIPLALLIEFVIELLYGVEYLEASNVVLVLLPGVLALSVFQLLTPNLVMRGRAWTYSFAVASSAIVMILLDLVLIPTYGLIGAGVASSIAYTVASLIVLVVVVRINDLPLHEYFNFVKELRTANEALKNRT